MPIWNSCLGSGIVISFSFENGAMGVGLLSEGLRAGDIIVRFSILPDEFAPRPVTGVD
jgi:hypothetical protein